MGVKEKLKERLLEIPIRSRAYREKNRLASDLNEDANKIEFYLNELCNLGIIIEKKEYICTCCSDTTVLNNKDLNNILEEDSFMYDNCCEYINPITDVTGFVYYDIEDSNALKGW